MGGVTEAGKVSVVRGNDKDRAARPDKSVEFLHGTHDVGDVFDDMDGLEAMEGRVAERVRERVEVGEDIGAAAGVAVEADGAGEFIDPAADIENAFRRHPH
jgi:hypothetical protein